MKIKLIRPYDEYKDDSNKYDIIFHKNKIESYNGVYPLSFDHFNEKVNSTKIINDTFEIVKLDKLDKNELNTNATHQIFSQKLHNVVGVYKYYIKLNFYQEFYINWYQKKYLIQSDDIKKDVLKYTIGAILGAIFTLITQEVSQTTKSEPQIEPKNTSQKSLEHK